MITVSVKDAVNAVDGVLFGCTYTHILPCPCTDSRSIAKGELFVPIKGEKFDGHNFIEAAFERGACGAMVEKLPPNFKNKCAGMWFIQVKDTTEAFLKLANLLRRSAHVKTVGITGSNGKTTTKDMCAAILAKRGHVLKTQGNLNNLIGLPITLSALDEKDEFAVLELGMSKPGEIAKLAKTADPDVGVITNVNSSHIEFFDSLEGIAEAKAELIDNVRSDVPLVLNRDDKYFSFMQDKARGRVISFGCSKEADIRAENIVWESPDGLRFTMFADGSSVECFVPVQGRHNVYNALAAACAARVLGMSLEDIAEGLRDVSLSPMRSQLLRCEGYTVYLDAYNANPASTKAAISYVQGMGKNSRSIVVLGDMLELGRAAFKEHKKIADMVLHGTSSILIIYGPIYEQVYAHTKCCYAGRALYLHCKTHEEIQNILNEHIREGDWILIKGSRGMKMETVANALKAVSPLLQGNKPND